MSRPLRAYAAPLLLSLLVAASLWPSLTWVDFSNESEQLVVAAALESRRDGSAAAWWRPTLNGEARLRKPPLATWAVMAVVSQDEARRLASGPIDAAAFAWITLKVRATALLAGALLLLLTFELGRLLGGRGVGLVALAVLASLYGFLEHAVRLTTDLYLALWVLAANVALCHAALHRRRARVALPLAGVALGLAMMSKGPVCLLQTLVPVGAFVLLRRHAVTQRLKLAMPRTAGGRHVPFPWVAAAVAALLFVFVGGTWYASAYFADPNVAAEWTTEISRVNATSVGADVPWDYAVWFALLLPWTLFFCLAAVSALCEVWRRMTRGYFGPPPGVERVRGPGAILATALAVVPIAIMIFFPDRKERYLLPMLPPAAVLTASGVAWLYRDARARPRGAAVAVGIHLFIVALVTLAVPLATMLLPRDARFGDDRPWLAAAVAVPLEVAGVLIVLGVVLAVRRWKLGGLVGGTTFAMLFAANVFFAGYGNFFNGRSEMRPLAGDLRGRLTALEMVHTGRRPPPDLSLFAARAIRGVPADPATGWPRVGGSSPTAWITYRGKREPDPPLPPGARVLSTAWRGDTLWLAIELPPGYSPAE